MFNLNFVNINHAYLFPIALTIFGGLIYHTSTQHVPNLHPSAILIIAYTIQLIFCIGWSIASKTSGDMSTALASGSAKYWIIGLAIASIVMEVGFILCYRAGWNLSSADITSVTVISLLFVVVETLVYNYDFNIKRMIGIAVCALGLVLIS